MRTIPEKDDVIYIPGVGSIRVISISNGIYGERSICGFLLQD